MGKLAVAAALAGAFVASTASEPVAVGQATATARCRVSSTAAHPVPGRPSFNVGNARLAVHLPAGATFVAIPDGSPRGGMAFIQKDGWIRTKLGWFARGGTPHVTGRRTDGKGGQVRADVGVRSYASSGAFYPSLLYFPSLGCWRLTATAGGAQLSAVVRVTR